MTTTNFPDGVTNAPSAGNTFGALMFPDPNLFHTFFDDFDNYTAGNWVVTSVGGGTQALTAGNNGLLLLTDTAADNDNNVLQKTPAAFAFTANKKAWFSARFKVSSALQSDTMFGIVIVNTTPIATPPTDGIYFLSSDDATSVQIVCRKNATTGSISATVPGLTLADDTFVNLQWYYNGDGRLFYGFNGQNVGSLDAGPNFLPDATNLTVTMVLQNGDGNARNMTVDQVFAAFER